MYFYAHDTAFAASVIVHSGSSTDADHAGYVASFSRINPRDRIYVFLLVIDAGSDVPGPKWRERIAEASRNVDETTLVVFVSDSALARGVITAVNWIRPPRYQFTVAGNVDEAISWIEGRRPGVRSVIKRLYVEARTAADAAMSKTMSLR